LHGVRILFYFDMGYILLTSVPWVDAKISVSHLMKV